MNFNIFKTTPKKSTDDILKNMLLPSGYQILEKMYLFCLMEESGENMMCSLAINDFQKKPTREKRDFIMNHFIELNSSSSLNISGKHRRAVNASVNFENNADNTRMLSKSKIKWGGVTETMQRVHSMQTRFKLPQMPTTFSDDFIIALRLNLSDTYERFTQINWTLLTHLDDRLFTIHRELVVEMKKAGFTLPRFMYKL